MFVFSGTPYCIAYDCISDLVPQHVVALAGTQTRSWAGFGVLENDEEKNR